MIRLDADGVPELVVTPASPDKARKVEMFYALKNPTSFARSWRDIAELEGPKGIKGFRSTDNRRGSGTEQLHGPKWKAPATAWLSFKFYCTEPQTVVLTAGDHHVVELEITASDEWQEMTIAPERLIHPVNQKPLPDWSSVGKLHFQPKPGSDLTKVLFAEFKWVKHNQESDSKSKANPR